MKIPSFLLQMTPSVADSSVTAEAGQKEETLLIIDLVIDSWPIMVPLFILSIVAIYIWVERFSAIQKASKINPSFMSNIKNAVSNGQFDEAKKICDSEDTPTSRMISKGVSRLGRPLEDISTAIENVGKLEVSTMEKNLSILATIAGAAPMIGFLGTVLGMMDTFHQMASGGNGGIQIEDLSSGIMYAMATTVAGLIVGIIAYLGYNLLVSKVDKVVHNMEDKALEFMDLLHQPAE
jgi:biopolymer transport protein ExbB